MSDERLIRQEKVEEAVTAMLDAAEGCGCNLLELVQACRAVQASTEAMIAREGKRIMDERG